MSEHTPTPWAVDPGKVGNTDIVYRNPHNDGRGMGITIHSGIDENGYGFATNQDRIDAAFIVRAVNNFEGLLEAAKDVQTELWELKNHHQEPQGSPEQEALDNAIAEAEDKSNG